MAAIKVFSRPWNGHQRKVKTKNERERERGRGIKADRQSARQGRWPERSALLCKYFNNRQWQHRVRQTDSMGRISDHNKLSNWLAAGWQRSLLHWAAESAALICVASQCKLLKFCAPTEQWNDTVLAGSKKEQRGKKAAAVTANAEHSFRALFGQQIQKAPANGANDG